MKLPDWKTCVGYLVAIAALALSLPGVQVVRADDAAVVISVNLIESESSCAPDPAPGVTRSAQVFLETDSDLSDGPDPIALDTQGYSYRAPSVDPNARQLEQH